MVIELCFDHKCIRVPQRNRSCVCVCVYTHICYMNWLMSVETKKSCNLLSSSLKPETDFVIQCESKSLKNQEQRWPGEKTGAFAEHIEQTGISCTVFCSQASRDETMPTRVSDGGLLTSLQVQRIVLEKHLHRHTEK